MWYPLEQLYILCVLPSSAGSCHLTRAICRSGTVGGGRVDHVHTNSLLFCISLPVSEGQQVIFGSGCLLAQVFIHLQTVSRPGIAEGIFEIPFCLLSMGSSCCSFLFGADPVRFSILSLVMGAFTRRSSLVCRPSAVLALLKVCLRYPVVC